jgi:hypothetical protein
MTTVSCFNIKIYTMDSSSSNSKHQDIGSHLIELIVEDICRCEFRV